MKLQTKNELKFENRFLDKIEQGIKRKKIRNSPVELGIYELRDGLSIDVYRVTKYDLYILDVEFELADYLGNIQEISLEYEELGFNSREEGKEFYKNHLKHDFCYLIEFRVIAGENNEKV